MTKRGYSGYGLVEWDASTKEWLIRWLDDAMLAAREARNA